MNIENASPIKKAIAGKLSFPTRGIFIILLFFIVNTGCQKNESTPSATTDQSFPDMKIEGSRNFIQVNLVSDTSSYNPLRIDPNLVNAWGISFGSTGAIWISSNGKGLSVVYDADGNQLIPPINIPFNGNINGSAPTGQVFNGTSNFVIPSTGETSKFIFATEDGIISAWASGDTSVTVASRATAGAVYKALAMASNNGTSMLYAADFHNAKIDVLDGSFNYVTDGGFVDPDIPAGYAPFNIRNIGGQLYVTYAKQLPPENKDDDKGPGHGYVDVYSLNGNLISRLISQGNLNSPWGITRVPNQNIILVGNFGDGKINAYDTGGNFVGTLTSGGSPLVIDGLWALTFPQNSSPKNRLYFTAGPDDESHGLFGYLSK